MLTADRITTLEQAADPELARQARETLEAGRVVYLPQLGFRLSEAERALLRDPVTLLRRRRDRNSLNGRPTIMYHPDTKRVSARILTRTSEEPIRAMLQRFSGWTQELLAALFPDYVSAVELDRATFRPCDRSKVQGLHVDSSPGHPTQGRSMLRIFCNVDPDEQPRVWQVGEHFDDFAARFLPAAQHEKRQRGRLVEWIGMSRGPRTPYDALIEKLRSAAKRDAEYQANGPRQIIHFPPGSTWIAITDLVVHAAISGRHSLDQTFYLPPEAMARPEASSLRTLERMTGQALL